MMLPTKIVRDCIALTPTGYEMPLKAGTVGEYDGHDVGGNVWIKVDGRRLLVDPRATDIK